LVEVTDAIYLAQDRDGLFRTLEAGAAELGCNGFLLSCHKPTRQEVIPNPTLTNFPEAFLHGYQQLELGDGDFILDAILDTNHPTMWDTSQPQCEDTRRQNYLDLMCENQLLAGIAIPLKHRPNTISAFVLSSATSALQETGIIQAANIMANAAMTKAEILGLCSKPSAACTKGIHALSAIQIEILNWVADGKSNPDIATIVGLNERAIRYHVTEILRKLGVATRMQAAAIRKSTGFRPRL